MAGYEREGEERAQQLLRRTRDGRWCVCGGNCFPVLFAKSSFDVTCCHESEPVDRLLQQHTEFGHPEAFKCITKHPAFHTYCLYRTGLEQFGRLFLSDSYLARDGDRNAALRYCAYRQYTLWVHGKLGFQNRRCIPQCVTKKIWTAFPEMLENVYRGFEEVDLADVQ